MKPSITKNTEKSKLIVSKVYESQFQKDNSLTAELRQEITTTTSYPKTSMNNSLNADVFTSKDFGIESEDFTSTETRIFFLNVPSTFDTPEKVQAHLDKFPDLNLYKILSNKPILSEEDKRAIEQGFITLDTKANSQIIRYPDNTENAGKIALTRENKAQYRRISLAKEFKEDIDLRTEDPNDIYLSREIAEELEVPFVETDITIMQGQTL